MERRPKILLVDDDSSFVAINRAVLQRHNFEVMAAFSAQTGLELASKWKPDLIILDLMLESRTEGFHAVYDLRKDVALRDVPILVITAINRSDYHWRFEPEETWFPVDGLLDKPTNPNQLVQEVNQLLSRSKALPTT